MARAIQCAVDNYDLWHGKNHWCYFWTNANLEHELWRHG
jgi:hypothetical protein